MSAPAQVKSTFPEPTGSCIQGTLAGSSDPPMGELHDIPGISRIATGGGAAWRDRGGVVAAVGLLAAGCSAVTPAQEGSGASGGASSAAADADSFGTAGAGRPGQGRRHAAWRSRPSRTSSTRPSPAASTRRYVFTRHVREAVRRRRQSAQIVPQLAAALPQISADGKTVTIKLRQGVEVRRRHAFDAAAVKTTLEREPHPRRVGAQERARPDHQRRGDGRRRP